MDKKSEDDAWMRGYLLAQQATIQDILECMNDEDRKATIAHLVIRWGNVLAERGDKVRRLIEAVAPLGAEWRLCARYNDDIQKKRDAVVAAYDAIKG